MSDKDKREMTEQEALGRYWRMLLEGAKAAEQKPAISTPSNSPSRVQQIAERYPTLQRTAAIKNAPRRENYETDEAYEEALGGWRHRTKVLWQHNQLSRFPRRA